MDVIGEGTTSLIKQSYHAGYVEKRYKRSNNWRLAVTEKAVHARIAYLLERVKSPLRTPKLFDPYDAYYIMEEVSTDRPLWHEEVWEGLDKELQETLLAVLRSAFKGLFAEGYNMRDVEVYLQPDNTLVVLDFGQVTSSSASSASSASHEFRLQSAAVVPPAVAESFLTYKN